MECGLTQETNSGNLIMCHIVEVERIVVNQNRTLPYQEAKETEPIKKLVLYVKELNIRNQRSLLKEPMMCRLDGRDVRVSNCRDVSCNSNVDSKHLVLVRTAS